MGGLGGAMEGGRRSRLFLNAKRDCRIDVAGIRSILCVLVIYWRPLTLLTI